MSDDRFSLLLGGPLYRMSQASGLHRTRTPLAVVVAISLIVIVLVPMMIAAALEGTLMRGVQVPLLRDYIIAARFLIAVPVLVLAAPIADDRLWRAVQHLRDLVEPEDHERFKAGLKRIERWRNSVWPQLLMFAIAVAISYFVPIVGLHDEISDWRGDANGLSNAGLWLVWVGNPVFRFIGMLWLWLLLLWVCLLWKFSRLHLALHAAHPDGRGGLAFLGYAQAAFIPLPMVGGVLLAGTLAMDVLYHDAGLRELRVVMIGSVVISVAFVIAPLLLLTPRLAELKRNSLLAYGALGTDCSEEFESKWLGRARGDASPILEAGDSSALVDLTGVYATVSGMSVVPMQRFILFQFLLAAALPLLPVVLMRMPVNELLKKLLSVLA